MNETLKELLATVRASVDADVYRELEVEIARLQRERDGAVETLRSVDEWFSLPDENYEADTIREEIASTLRLIETIAEGSTP